MNRPRFQTFGCKLNSYETETIKNLCEKEDIANITVINTCAVTAEAVRKAKKAIRKSYRENPLKKIIVTGCAAQIEPETFADMQEVDTVIGNEEKLFTPTWKRIKNGIIADASKSKIEVSDIMKVTKIKPWRIDKLGDRSRAYVQIQNGCDHRCTFCIIPFGRGNSRSVSIEDVLNQIQKLVDRGFNEIVLTGVDLTSWGKDLPLKPELGSLVKQVLLEIPALPRLRLSSIDSIEVDQTLIEIIINEKRFMPHLHLSLQSGDNLILKRMKRRHSREQAIDFCQLLKRERPEITFGADIIVGFPTESDAMFRKSLELINECNLTWLHVFPFSIRNGTPASRMPQVNGEIIKFRAKKLRSAGQAQVQKYLDSSVGKNHNVLIEGKGKGRTETFAQVLLDPQFKPGTIQSLISSGHNGSELLCV